MIIGINGYIGSGKDTIGQIIQELVIKHSKNTNSYDTNILASDGREFLSGWEIKKFAEKLKQMASLLTGIPREKFENQEFKNSPLEREWCFKDSVAGYGEQWQEMSVRMFLQKLGTEAIRDNLHNNAWVNALFSDYTATKKDGGFERVVKNAEGIPIDYHYEVEYPNWIITDCRFPNEAQAIKDKSGVIVRVDRMWQLDLPAGHISGNHNPINLHSSETSLDDWNFDYVIENNGTLEELTESVKVMLKTFNILS